MKKARGGYTEAHARSGLDAKLPAIETWPNQFKGYENVVNRILKDLVAVCRPVHARVIGEFSARGGLRSTIEARYP
jgi:7-cyano-7-deazaguanine reductase